MCVCLLGQLVGQTWWDGDCVIHCTYLFAEDEANTSQEPRTEIRSEKSVILKYWRWYCDVSSVIEALAHCWSPRLIADNVNEGAGVVDDVAVVSHIKHPLHEFRFYGVVIHILSDFHNILWASWYYQRPKSGGNHPWGVCASHNFRLVCDFNWECSGYKY